MEFKNLQTEMNHPNIIRCDGQNHCSDLCFNNVETKLHFDSLCRNGLIFLQKYYYKWSTKRRFLKAQILAKAQSKFNSAMTFTSFVPMQKNIPGENFVSL